MRKLSKLIDTWWLVWGPVFFIGVFLLVVFADPAKSHSWYDEQCCHDDDCREIDGTILEALPDGRYVLPKGMVIQTSRGPHRLDEALVIADGKIKNSLDGNYHLCADFISPGFGSETNFYVYCLYVPALGV